MWLVAPATRTVAVHESAERAVTLGEGDTIDGGGVLPGFTLALRSLFAVLDRRATSAAR